MRHLLASVETVGRVETVPWDTYREELLGLLTRYHLPPDPHEARVQFAPLAEGRARPRARVYILGLAEGEFPARPAPDVFYAPAEREKHPLPLFQPSAADAASLWWQVLANTTEQLTLTRPYLDGNGAEWPPSPSWEAVTACFEALAPHRIPIAATPSPPQAANSRELSVALAQGRARQVPAEMESAWRAGQHGAAVMRQRASTLPAGVYEGQLLAPDLRDFLASKYRESHPWSASRLNAYPTCPYGFFAQYILQLEALPEPEEGLNAMQRGSLLHAILEDLYRAMAAQNLSPTLPNQTQVLALLEACGDARLPTAPQRYGFRPGPLWAQEQAELRRMLRAFVQWECEAHGETAAFEPWLQEAAFGLADGKPALPLTVEGVTFHLRGLIDRLDRDPAGNVRVVDYKSGSSTFSMNEIKRGTALQTVLYALAAQTLWAGEGGQVRESSYLHLPNRKKSGKVTFKDGERVEDNAVVQEGLGQAARSVQQVRAGHFPSAPAKPVEGWTACRPGCEKAALCRVTRASLRKASQAGDRA
jgi:ATP-dependent helicase/DNAse subunit B